MTKNILDFSNLPIKNYNNKKCIDWHSSIGYSFNFISDSGITGTIKILNCENKNNSTTNYLTILYNNIEYTCSVYDLKKLNFLKLIIFSSPNIIKYLNNKNDAIVYKSFSNARLEFKCPICNDITLKTVNQVSRYGYSCKYCSDGKSYPEKIMRSVLKQCNINYNCEVLFKIGKYRRFWDFVLEDKKIIIEMDGAFHYKNIKMSRESLKERKEIDEQKNEWAKNNGYTLYRIDCSESSFEYIKPNIISTLKNVLDINLIDFEKADLDAQKNMMLEVCSYRKENPDSFSGEISRIFKLSKITITTYLKKGNELGLCNYNGKEESIRQTQSINGGNQSKSICIYDLNDNFIKEYNSIRDCIKNCFFDLGIQFDRQCVSAACNLLRNTNKHKGFIFKFK